MYSRQKIAVVTGAGSGIGRDFAIALLNAGHGVTLAGRRERALEQTAEISGNASNALVVPTDITQPKAVSLLFAKTKKAFDRLDLLFKQIARRKDTGIVEEQVESVECFLSLSK